MVKVLDTIVTGRTMLSTGGSVQITGFTKLPAVSAQGGSGGKDRL